MTLITLLIVLTIERIAITGQLWQFNFYFSQLTDIVDKHFASPSLLDNPWGRWLWIITPAAVVLLISNGIDWLLFDLAFNILVMLVCIGCVHKRKLYKSFLNAANRGDEEAVQLYGSQLQGLDVEKESTVAQPMAEKVEACEQEYIEQVHSEQPQQPDMNECTEAKNRRLGLTLVWFNFKYYCAVLFWFVCIGPAGAVLYCMVRETTDTDNEGIKRLFSDDKLSRLRHILDWLPARICSAGYLLIGDFSRSAGIWLSYLLDFTSPSKDLVCEIADAAQRVDLECEDKVVEPACMLKLAKRNILFFLALVAILTLYGGID